MLPQLEIDQQLKNSLGLFSLFLPFLVLLLSQALPPHIIKSLALTVRGQRGRERSGIGVGGAVDNSAGGGCEGVEGDNNRTWTQEEER